jgi:hypothetical protein
VRDERERAARLEHVVDGLSNSLFVGPVERLTERHQPVRSRSRSGQIFCQRLNPPNVGQALSLRRAPTLGQHVGIRIKPDDSLEQRGETDGEDARAAAGVEESP